MGTTLNVQEKRVAKALKTCRKYLTWVQNSVFECLLDMGSYVNFKAELIKLIDLEKDSLRFYELGNHYQKKIDHIGVRPKFSAGDVLIL